MSSFVAQKNNEGVALVVALLFVVLLAALVVDFAYEMQVDASLVSSGSSDFEAYIAAKSAVAASMGLLATDLFVGEEAAASGFVDEVFDSFDDPWGEGIPMAPQNNGVMQATVADEYGKINLNALIYREGEEEVVFAPIEDRLRYLFEYRNHESAPADEIIDCIIDWLDSDDEAEPAGAENEYYTSLENPYGCKNGPMDSIEELLLIPGITPEVYFGDPDEDLLPLPELLTVHGHPEGRINVNTAPFEVLQAHFTATGRFPDPAVAAEELYTKIVDEGPFTSLEELISGNWMEDPNAQQPEEPRPVNEQEEREDGENQPEPVGPETPMLHVYSSVFRIWRDGKSEEAAVRIEAYVWRDTLQVGSANTFRILDWRVIR